MRRGENVGDKRESEGERRGKRNRAKGMSQKRRGFWSADEGEERKGPEAGRKAATRELK